MNFDVVTIGGATRDVFFRTSQGKIISSPQKKFIAFEYGAKIVPEKAHFSYGGGGANTAIALARLGLKTACFLSLGQEGTGDIVLANLKKAGVETKYIRRDRQLHTALSVILSLPEGERVIFRYPGADSNLKINWAKFPPTNFVYLTSLRGNSEKIVSQLFLEAKKRHFRVVFNPGRPQLSRGLNYLKPFLKRTYLLNLNFEEALTLLGARKIVFTKKKVEALLKKIHQFGPQMVLITCGEKGAYLFEGQKIYFQKSLKKKVVDTTGAGDAFGSAFVGGLILGFPVQKALKMAALNASSVIACLGAQDGLLTLKILQKRLSQ